MSCPTQLSCGQIKLEYALEVMATVFSRKDLAFFQVKLNGSCWACTIASCQLVLYRVLVGFNIG